jgi:hypothetical protein
MQLRFTSRLRRDIPPKPAPSRPVEAKKRKARRGYVKIQYGLRLEDLTNFSELPKRFSEVRVLGLCALMSTFVFVVALYFVSRGIWFPLHGPSGCVNPETQSEDVWLVWMTDEDAVLTLSVYSVNTDPGFTLWHSSQQDFFKVPLVAVVIFSTFLPLGWGALMLIKLLNRLDRRGKRFDGRAFPVVLGKSNNN